MSATITGIVFNDLNHNGQYDSGEPGIPGVFIVLSGASGCISMQTDINGSYSFSISAAGIYTVYEPVADPDGACPPTVFTEPAGYTMSNGPRKLSVTVTAAQISNNTTITGKSFSHDTVDAPIFCDTTMIQFVGQPTEWCNINIITGTPIMYGLLNPADYVNAIGYNTLDNYVYGYDLTTSNIVRVDSQRNIITLSPDPTGLPAQGYNAGTFDLNGFFYFFVNNTARFYTVDLRPGSSTYMKLVSPGNGYAEQTSNYGTALSATVNVSDWVYNAADGFLYGIDRTGTINRINPVNGQVTALATVGPNPGASFGAVVIDASNTIYAISNGDGSVYRYTITGNSAVGVYFSTTYYASSNDATMCPNINVLIDFGDAPDLGAGNGQNNYNTLMAQNGPRHGLVNELYLGTKVTAESDAYQNSDATGDDISQGIQDDGLTVPLPTLSVSASTYSLSVSVSNNTGLPANLYGWVDFNQNGLFETDEAAAVQIIPSQSGLQTVILTFNIPVGTVLSTGTSFARLRLTTDLLTGTGDVAGQDPRSVGAASDGEVEDYILNIAPIADLSIIKTAGQNSVYAGNPLNFTLMVTNNGPDSAVSPLLVDSLPSDIHNPLFSLDNGVTWNAWMGSLILPSLSPAMSVEVLITGTISSYAAGLLTNTASVNSSTYDPDLSNNTYTVDVAIVDSADISIVKTSSPSQVMAGDILTYTLVVSNAGPSVAENVTLTDDILTDLQDVIFSMDGGVTWQPWISPFTLGLLVNSSTLTMLIRGTVTSSAAGSIINTATVNSDTPDPDVSNNTFATATPVNVLADLSITKTGDVNPILAGNVLTYTLTVSNKGPSDAQDIHVSDAIPPSMTDAQYSIDGGLTWDDWSGSYALETLANGAAFTFLIRGIVSTAATGILVNAATVESATPDPDTTNNSAEAIITINTLADLTISKTGDPSPISDGQLLTYTILVQNLGPDNAQDVVLTDVMPSALAGVEFSIDGGIAWQPWAGYYSIGTVSAGSAISILIRGTVNPQTIGSITNTAVVSSTTPDPNLSNNSITENTPVNPFADLSLRKVADTTSATAGMPLSYTITVTNLGLNDAQNAILTDAVPNILLTPEVSIDGINWNPWPGSYPLGTIAYGATVEIYIRGTVDPTAEPALTTNIVNTAIVGSDIPDPDLTNNSDTAIVPLSSSADLAIAKSADASLVQAGGMLVYTIVITNNGPSDAQNVILIDAIPSSIMNPEISLDGGVTWKPWINPYSIGTVAKGAAITTQIRGIVSSAVSGTISNTASVSSTTPDSNLANNSAMENTPVQSSADLAVVKTSNLNPVTAGTLLSYTIVISNYGPSNAQGVTLTDAVPAYLSDAEYSMDGGITWDTWNGIYTIATLANGASITMQIRGTVNPSAEGSISNTATVDSTTPDPNLSNNTFTVDTSVEDSADISVEVIGNPSYVTVGDSLSYTLIISNAGPSNAQDVTLTDQIPASITSAEYSVDNGATWNPWSSLLSVGTLPSGGTTTILVRGTVNSLADGNISYTAAVSSSTSDPNMSNNTTATQTPVVNHADIAVTKTAYPDQVQPGSILTYTLKITNNGSSSSQNVLLSDQLPDSIIGAEYSLDNGAVWHPWTSPLIIGTLPSGSSVTILIRGTLEPSSIGDIINVAIVSSDTPDLNIANNSSTATTPVTDSADIGVLKTADADSVTPGIMLSYRILVYNNGLADAKNVVLTDIVPACISNPQFSTDEGASFNPWSGSLNLGTLSNGTSQLILISGNINANSSAPIVNTATVTTTTTVLKPQNCTSTIKTAITDRGLAVNQILSSIAMEGLALSHILNAEGEKLQYVLGTLHNEGSSKESVDNSQQ